MAIRKFKKYKKPIINTFADGGPTKNKLLSGIILGVGALGDIATTAINNAQITSSDDVEQAILSKKSYNPNVSSLDSLMNEYSNLLNMSHVNWRDFTQSGGLLAASAVGSTLSGAGAGAMFGPIGAAAGAVVGLAGSLFGSLGAKKKALRKARKLNNQIDEANQYLFDVLQNSADVLDRQNDLNLLSSFYGEGGKIHIKKANRGKFTDYCGGKVTSECIAKGKRSNDPAVRKRATFAANARKWHKKALGGFLEDYITTYDNGGNLTSSMSKNGLHGGIFSNGVTMINEGSTHETNPLLGVPMGLDQNGIPNLVEEGEVKFNDYIFSNRLKADKDLLDNAGLGKKYKNSTYAAIAHKLNKESAERPNDPISLRGLNSFMSRLLQAQELLKLLEGINSNDRQENIHTNLNMLYAGGGPLGTLDELNQDSIGLEDLLIDNIGNGSKITGNPFLNLDPDVLLQFNNLNTDNIFGVNTEDSGKDRKIGLDLLRYLPALGSGIGLLSNLTSKQDGPDFEEAGIIQKANTGVSFNPLGNYLTYQPLDRNYYINKLSALSAANRRAIQELSGGNRGAAISGLLASDYNSGIALGELARQAEEYNQALRERVELFNRGTNLFNSEGDFRALLANNEATMRTAAAVALLRNQAKQLALQSKRESEAVRSANLTNFLNNLGEIGREEYSRNMINNNPALYYELSRSGKTKYKSKDKNNKKSGGFLTI